LFYFKTYIDNTTGDEGIILFGEEARAMVLLSVKTTHIGHRNPNCLASWQQSVYFMVISHSSTNTDQIGHKRTSQYMINNEIHKHTSLCLRVTVS